MNGASRGLLPPGDPHYFNRTRGQLRDLPGVDSLYFTMLNHNKRSITLNTKTARGRAIFTRLVEECDVLVENFAPGALDRMGFTWERIQEINPRIVYASVKGFGPGPYQECKVYENVAQCTGGSASTTGFDDGPPLVTGAQTLATVVHSRPNSRGSPATPRQHVSQWWSTESTSTTSCSSKRKITRRLPETRTLQAG